MRELLIVAVLIAALVGLAALLLVAWETLFYWGIVLVAAGMVVGVPTGFVYHVLLYRVLKRRSKLAKGWIWKPFELHVHLDHRDRLSVMPWAYVGALGFFAVVLGQVLLASAIFKCYVGT
ncbi:MAG: hypothetical protein JRG91_07600 [Deltaproteobacteria bacterium]|nr:hypothetical protein [Deltaproteobacteria bacterium]